MFIIFDLDDTLIDTTGSILPFKFRAILEKFFSNKIEQCFSDLLSYSQGAKSSIDAVKQFAQNKGLSNHFLAQAKEILGNDQLPKKVSMLPLAKPILNHLKKDFKLFLVTFGNKSLQMAKMKSAGIDKGYFCKIVVTDQPDKRCAYQALFEEFSLDPHKGIVIGDRVDRDLKPAKELGCYTVHMKWGRRSNQEIDQMKIDRQVEHLSDFLQICLKKIGKI